MTQPIEISVVIPSYNGRHKLPELIDRLAAQSLPPREVVVVVDGSKDGSAEWLRSLKFPVPLKIIEQENQGRASTRNNGAAQSEGNVLLFFDDDMRPAPHCLARHADFHGTHANAVLVGPTDTDPRLLNSDLGRYRWQIEQQWFSTMPQFRGPAVSPEPYICGAHFSLRKELFERLGGFLVGLNDWEDREFALRAADLGIEIYFDRTATAYHFDPFTSRSYTRRHIQYRRAYDLAARRRPDLFSKWPRLHPEPPRGARRLIYSLFAHDFWLDVIDHHNELLRVFPERIRYRFYSLVTHGLANYFPERLRD